MSTETEKLKAEIERLKILNHVLAENRDEWVRLARSHQGGSETLLRLMARLDQVAQLEAEGWRPR